MAKIVVANHINTDIDFAMQSSYHLKKKQIKKVSPSLAKHYESILKIYIRFYMIIILMIEMIL